MLFLYRPHTGLPMGYIYEVYKTSSMALRRFQYNRPLITAGRRGWMGCAKRT